MGLFCYHRDTTPKLDLLKNDPNFIYKRSVASGVNTYLGFTFFMNLQRDPRNYDVVLSNRYNLHGTYYINGKGIAGESDYIKYNKGAEDKIVYSESN
jgi:hypothetical protein